MDIQPLTEVTQLITGRDVLYFGHGVIPAGTTAPAAAVRGDVVVRAAPEWSELSHMDELLAILQVLLMYIYISYSCV